MIHLDCSSYDFQVDGLRKTAERVHSMQVGQAPGQAYLLVLPGGAELQVNCQGSNVEEVEENLKKSFQEAILKRALKVELPQEQKKESKLKK